MVVIDQRHPFVGVALHLQVVPVLQPVSQGLHPVQHRGGQAEPNTGALVDHRRLGHRQGHGLADALQFRHRQLVVHGIRGHAIHRQPPLVFGTVGQFEALDHRDIEFLQRGTDAFSAFAATDHKILQADQPCQGGRTQGFRQFVERLQAGSTPAGQDGEALDITAFQLEAGLVQQVPIPGTIATVQVQQYHCRTGGQVQAGSLITGLATTVVADGCPGTWRRHVHGLASAHHEPLHQTTEVFRRAPLVIGPPFQPQGLRGETLLLAL